MLLAEPISYFSVLLILAGREEPSHYSEVHMKKVSVNVLLSAWIFFVISLYWIVVLGPGYYEIANKYSWVAYIRTIAMTWFYRDYIF